MRRRLVTSKVDNDNDNEIGCDGDGDCDCESELLTHVKALVNTNWDPYGRVQAIYCVSYAWNCRVQFSGASSKFQAQPLAAVGGADRMLP